MLRFMLTSLLLMPPPCIISARCRHAITPMMYFALMPYRYDIFHYAAYEHADYCRLILRLHADAL